MLLDSTERDLVVAFRGGAFRLSANCSAGS
jgi:hypothetical protein